jgi:transposase
MAMGKRKGHQGGLWIATSDLARSPGHPFYGRLNRLLTEHGFDIFVEEQCRVFYAERMGRPSLPPGVYFRLLLIGYFEGIDSERGIAWRVADSLTLREFLGLSLSQSPPDHSTISRTRRLIDVETHQEVFAWVLTVLGKEGLLQGRTIGVDATTLEANAAMKSIVRRDTGEGYGEFLRRLAEESGEATPTRAELARKDKKRKGKGSNDDWTNPHDPDAKITKMKDGRTHLAHKAEHAVDLKTGAVVAVTVQPADRGDTQSLEATLEETLENLAVVIEQVELPEQVLREVVADRGYHSAAVLARTHELGLRSYIAEPKRPRRRWRGRKAEQKATYANHRRMKGSRGKKLARWRAEKVERSMAHNYETGGLRRIHLRGHDNILKRVLVHVAGFNLGLVMHKIAGHGTPRGLQGRFLRLFALILAAIQALGLSRNAVSRPAQPHPPTRRRPFSPGWLSPSFSRQPTFATGC